MRNRLKVYYWKFVHAINKFRVSNPDLFAPNWKDHFSAGLSILALIIGVALGVNSGLEYDGILGAIIFTPVMGLIGLIFGAILGILLTTMFYIAIWILVFFGLIIILVLIGDGSLSLWESAKQAIGL